MFANIIKKYAQKKDQEHLGLFLYQFGLIMVSYDYKGEPESIYDNAFEFDYNRYNFEKDKDLPSENEFELINILKKNIKNGRDL